MALLTVLALSAPATAKPHASKFKLTVSGVQTSTWARHQYIEQDSDLQCGLNIVQSGGERFDFATKKAIAVTAQPYRYGGFTVPQFRFGKRKSFPVTSTVDRSETDTSQDTCTGQPYPPDPPLDCGRRQAAWSLTLASDYRRSGGIWLGVDSNRLPPGDLFNTCRQTLFEWPEIQDHDPNGKKTWVGAVPNARFFKRKPKKFTVTADWSAKGDPQTTSEDSSAVHLTWKLVFTRLHH